MAKKRDSINDLKFIIYLELTVFILLLSIFNLQKITNKKVLGSSVEKLPNKLESEKLFWEKFLEKHPTYIDGWIELKRFDKVKEIDPNY